MSFGNPNNPYGQQPPQAPYGAPQQPAQYGYPQQAAPGYGHPQQPGMPVGPGVYASWGSRFGAFLIDFLIAGLVPLIAVITAVILQTTTRAVCFMDHECKEARLPFVIALPIVAFLWLFIANIFILVKEGKGASPGKKAMKIRLIREETGRPLGFGLALLRRICHGLDSAPCSIGYLWPAWDAKGQTFADKVMRTVVVRTE